MKTAFSTFLILLGLAAISFAQQDATEAPAFGHDATTGVHTIEGCLTRSNHVYIITGGDGGAQYRITGGDTSSLAHKMNHTVAVTGELGKSDPREPVSEPFNASSTTGVGYSTIVAQKIKDISPICSHIGTGK